MKKVLLSVWIVLGAQMVCAADTWSDMLRAYKMDLSTLVRGNGYQIFRSEAGGMGIAYSEVDAEGQCHFSLAMVPMEARAMRWLPGAGAAFLEVQDASCYSSVMALQETEGPETDPKLGSFSYVYEPGVFIGTDGRILNLAYFGDKLAILVERSSRILWLGEDGNPIEVAPANLPSEEPSPTLRIADTRAVDIGLSVFWADRNVGADAPEAYGEYFPFATPVPWGGSWRTPSYKELGELVTKCSWELTTRGGTAGYKVTGPNGNSIFLPLGGDVDYEGNLDGAGDNGAIWSSERPEGQYYIDNGYAIFLQMTQSDVEKYRHYIRVFNLGGTKRNLRPVMPKP